MMPECYPDCMRSEAMGSMKRRSICEVLRPPPFPPKHSDMYAEIYNFAIEDETYQEYAELCNITVKNTTGKSTTDSTGTSTRSMVTFTSTLQSTITHTASSTPSNVTTTTPALDSASSASSATVVVIVLLILAILVGILVFVWWYMKKRKSQRGSVNVNSLPLKSYENTNYLANKAQAGQCWNPANNQSELGNSGNQYGSFPPLNGNDKSKNIMNNEKIVEDELVRLGSGFEKSEAIGYVNENFDQKNEDENRSPGVDSQTPFIDMIDGVLPNAVPPSGTESCELKSNTEEAVEEDSGNVDSQSSLNPSVERRPRKKKKYVSNSAHVEITEDLATKRKTV